LLLASTSTVPSTRPPGRPEGGHDDDGEEGGEVVVFPFGFAPVGGGAAEVPEAAQLGGRGGGARDDAVFDGLEVGGEPGGPELGSGAGLGVEFAHPELLWAVVGDVVVLLRPLEASGGSEQGPALRFVAGPPEELAIDEAFDQ